RGARGARRQAHRSREGAGGPQRPVGARRKGIPQGRLNSGSAMEQRTDDGLSPYRVFTRSEWAQLRADTPVTADAGEVAPLRSLNDRLDMQEVEEIYLPLSRLLSMYVAATQRLFRAQERFLGAGDAKMPYIIGVAGSVAAGKSTTARVL